MQKTAFFIFSILTIILFSCKDNYKENKILTDFFEKNRIIEFVRPENTEDFYYTQYFETDTAEIFVNLEWNRNILDFYDISNGKLLKTFSIPLNIVISGFYINNNNSIFLIPKIDYTILEFKNNKIDTLFYLRINNTTFEFIKNHDLGNYLEFVPSVVSPLVYCDSTIFVNNIVNYKDEYIYRRPIFIYSLKSTEKRINTKVGRFPSYFPDNDERYYPFDDIVPFCINNKKEVVVGFCNVDSLYIYNGKSYENVRSVYCKSNFINKFIPSIKIKQIQDMKLYLQRSNENNFYIGIFYDNYRDVYYRLVKLKNKNNCKNLIDENDFDFLIMILDNKFNIIGEQLFNNKEFMLSTQIITREGIMFRNPDDLSGVTRYSVFKINEKYLKR